MNTFLKLAFSCLAAVSMAVCSASEYTVNRAPADGAIYKNITVGKTTRLDLDAALGSATVVKLDPGYEVWVYKNQVQAPSSSRFLPLLDTKGTREVAVMFDRAGVVRKFRIHEPKK
ncbi:hypothetical protein [Janthinobacterium psychrotolerans]|uniref:Lipoprotein SmpA/OmlA domain-containing protein n=1 Tax=Janthinobacterium psychrotolerans TaxID=1747903 RepID=A0A1A7C0F3_9BURK|nr:hypothetical protein [Janthinobacterium psychrotolerans]OBV38484.1 hypothetical protein ASR47_100684 [Janthinobacterium psychrotolerans]